MVVIPESDIGVVRPRDRERERDGWFVQWAIRFTKDAKVLVDRGSEEERKNEQSENGFFRFRFYFFWT